MYAGQTFQCKIDTLTVNGAVRPKETITEVCRIKLNSKKDTEHVPINVRDGYTHRREVSEVM